MEKLIRWKDIVADILNCPTKEVRVIFWTQKAVKTISGIIEGEKSCFVRKDKYPTVFLWNIMLEEGKLNSTYIIKEVENEKA